MGTGPARTRGPLAPWSAARSRVSVSPEAADVGEHGPVGDPTAGAREGKEEQFITSREVQWLGTGPKTPRSSEIIGTLPETRRRRETWTQSGSVDAKKARRPWPPGTNFRTRAGATPAATGAVVRRGAGDEGSASEAESTSSAPNAQTLLNDREARGVDREGRKEGPPGSRGPRGPEAGAPAGGGNRRRG